MLLTVLWERIRSHMRGKKTFSGGSCPCAPIRRAVFVIACLVFLVLSDTAAADGAVFDPHFSAVHAFSRPAFLVTLPFLRSVAVNLLPVHTKEVHTFCGFDGVLK